MNADSLTPTSCSLETDQQQNRLGYLCDGEHADPRGLLVHSLFYLRAFLEPLESCVLGSVCHLCEERLIISILKTWTVDCN